MIGVLSDIDAIVCYACMCMDVCVVFYELRPVGEMYVVIKKKKKDVKIKTYRRIGV